MTSEKKQMSRNGLPDYSVLMSVYRNDRAEWFETAVESMARQTHPPREIVIVEDGEISDDLRLAEKHCEDRHKGLIRIVPLPVNLGLGKAMERGVKECRCEWIARMDSDDFSEPKRCEKELEKAIREGADIVGCDCEEFIGTVDRRASRRLFPETHDEIVAFSRKRTPFCHPAVMMKKSMVLAAGNYRSAYLFEDYGLFVRMLAQGARSCSVKEILFHVRVSEDFYGRRGGVKYMVTLLRFNVHLLKTGWMRPVDFLERSAANVIVGLAPNRMRQWIYMRILRK